MPVYTMSHIGDGLRNSAYFREAKRPATLIHVFSHLNLSIICLTYIFVRKCMFVLLS